MTKEVKPKQATKTTKADIPNEVIIRYYQQIIKRQQKELAKRPTFRQNLIILTVVNLLLVITFTAIVKL
jgi:hypothetical protein